MLHICGSESGQHWFRKWLVTYSASNHYLNQCWVIVNWTPRNKLQRNFSQNRKFSFMKMHFKLSSVKWRPFCPGGDELTYRGLLTPCSNIDLCQSVSGNGLLPIANCPEHLVSLIRKIVRPECNGQHLAENIFKSIFFKENQILTHWPLGDLNAIPKMEFSILFYWLVSSDRLMIMPYDECHRTLLMISQHWFR